MQVTLIKENSDGSANYSFDLTREEEESLIRAGILSALKEAIRLGDELKIVEEDDENEQSTDSMGNP
jgi:hypothetical protein